MQITQNMNCRVSNFSLMRITDIVTTLCIVKVNFEQVPPGTQGFTHARKVI